MQVAVLTDIPDKCSDLLTIEVLTDGVIKNFFDYGNHAIVEIDNGKYMEASLRVGKRVIGSYKGEISEVVKIDVNEEVKEALEKLCQ